MISIYHIVSTDTSNTEMKIREKNEKGRTKHQRTVGQL